MWSSRRSRRCGAPRVGRPRASAPMDICVSKQTHFFTQGLFPTPGRRVDVLLSRRTRCYKGVIFIEKKNGNSNDNDTDNDNDDGKHPQNAPANRTKRPPQKGKKVISSCTIYPLRGPTCAFGTPLNEYGHFFLVSGAGGARRELYLLPLVVQNARRVSDGPGRTKRTHVPKSEKTECCFCWPCRYETAFRTKK